MEPAHRRQHRSLEDPSMAEITAQIDPNLKPERIDTYKYWQAEQKIPVVRGFFVEDVNTLPVEQWD
jgi:hypothetical protein